MPQLPPPSARSMSSDFRGEPGEMCELLHTSPVVQKMMGARRVTHDGCHSFRGRERERRRPILLWFLTTLLNPAAALGDEALGKRGEGCRASPLLRRGRTMQTLAKDYEDRAAECSRSAQQTDDPVFRRLLFMLASQWKSSPPHRAVTVKGLH